MRRFLLYICERSLTGQGELIHEQQIGTAVFGRKLDYSPNDDNIVRVEARNLRKRLQEYFEQDGREEPIVITVPKGGYAPIFQPRGAKVVSSAATVLPGRFALYWGLVALLMGAVGVLLVRDLRRGRSNDLIWTELLDPANQTTIVLADSNLALYQDLTRRNIRLDEYIGGSYIAGEQDPALSTVARRQYTSVADATLAARIAGLQPSMPCVVRFARFLQVRDFHSGNAIIFGSKRANPWVELFEPQLNFTTAYDAVKRTLRIVNKAPRAGEAAEYVMESDVGKTGRAYALVSLVPNLTRSGRVLILQGSNMEGTEAVGQFVLSTHLSERLRTAVGGAAGRPLPAFEVLVRLQAIGGAAKDMEIIAVRRWPM